jgi:hypothetical protein
LLAHSALYRAAFRLYARKASAVGALGLGSLIRPDIPAALWVILKGGSFRTSEINGFAITLT